MTKFVRHESQNECVMLTSKILYLTKKSRLFETLVRPAKELMKKRLEKEVMLHPLRREKLLHEMYFGSPLDLYNPSTVYDKLLLMEFCSDVSEWQRLTDKVTVRDFVKERGLEHLLNEVYFILDEVPSFEQFIEMLPASCVVKTNNSGGSEAVHIISDKNKTDLRKVYRQLCRNFADNYGVRTGQMHYKNIVPKIIIERLIENDFRPGQPINDYKFLCINGEPQAINVIAERDIATHTYLDQFYDIDMNRFDWEQQNGQRLIERPASLAEMVEAARILAKGFPFVRVDFYESKGRPVFSEMTFTPGHDFFVSTYGQNVLRWGEMLDISNVEIDYSKLSPDLF